MKYFKTKEENKKFERALEGIDGIFRSNGVTPTLTKIEGLVAIAIGEGRSEYFKLRRAAKNNPRLPDFIDYIQIAVLGSTNLKRNEFMNALKSLKSKGVFNELDLKTGLTGQLKYDMI